MGPGQPEPGDGFANEPIYRLGRNASTQARDFHDITARADGVFVTLPGWGLRHRVRRSQDRGNLVIDAR